MMIKKKSVNLKKVIAIAFLFVVNFCVSISCTTERNPHGLNNSHDDSDTANSIVPNIDSIGMNDKNDTSVLKLKDTIDLGRKKNLPNGKHIRECMDLLVGHWFMPHSAFIYIDFNSDSTFVFMDYNIDLGESEKLTGKYSIDGNRIYLNYNDRKRQAFSFIVGESEYDSYIKKGEEYYFVKSRR